ncbi:membrane protein [Arthrobacter phage SilentRX]|uniref:Membrane protein n=1 Tax=Arthrobacter phage SilentRX TaxID=2836091 RepID=A0A8F3E7L8_9CAUD|nr:membrane protein [Arthrobacter phage SilentRX]QWY82818.1 membrane protein [Arthrobacter phage SilentRX]
MYGSHTTTAAAGSTLAYTGAQTGVWALIAVGLIVAGIAVLTLVRRPGKVKP